MSEPIYLDYMSTTPVDPRVADVMQSCLTQTGTFGNPASATHRFGWEAGEKIAVARAQVAALIKADPREIIWTSGATESINLALKGAAHAYQRQGKHIITLQTEHKAVLDTCAVLEGEGFEVTYLPVLPDGLLDVSVLAKAIRSDTILVSLLHVNNETGVIQDVAEIGDFLKNKGVLFHVDAAQSVGKISIDLSKISVDLMSLSSHKLYGPKGIGALYVRRRPRVQLEPLLHGGAQEHGLRAGTLPTHQIAGMGLAYAIAQADLVVETKRVAALRDRLQAGIAILPQVTFNGSQVHRVCGCLSVTFDGVDGETLTHAFYDLAVSLGSACNSANPEPSHVLTAMGLSRREANCTLRFSVGRFTTEIEVDHAVDRIVEQVSRLRALSPTWHGA